MHYLTGFFLNYRKTRLLRLGLRVHVSLLLVQTTKESKDLYYYFAFSLADTL